MSNRVKGLLKQPLPYFVLIGAGAFAIESALAQAEQVIVVSDVVRDNVAATLSAELGRSPTEDELADGVERWMEDEALYREGVKLGLLENDVAVRNLVASRMRFIASERSVLDEPSDETLREYLRTHEASFRTPPTFDVDHVFIANNPPRPLNQAEADATTTSPVEIRAEQTLQKLAAGAEPKELGDHFPRGPSFVGKSLKELQQLLDADVGALTAAPLAEWRNYPGRRGRHLIRVRRASSGLPDFDQLKPALRLAVLAQLKEQHAKEYAAEVKSKYRFTGQP